MGANAQTSVTLFVANAILTAQQQNFSAATGVPVFATTVTRDAAFGGSNKVLAEGQLCYLESTDVVQYYTGSAWATVGPATASALVRVGGGAMSGTSTAFTNVFSATYDAYSLIFTNMATTANTAINIILGATTAGYYSSVLASSFAASAYSSSFGSVNNGAAWFVANIDTTNQGLQVDLFNPFLATKSIYKTGPFMAASIAGVGQGYLNNSTSYTGFTISAGTSGNLTGTCNIYGYALS